MVGSRFWPWKKNDDAYTYKNRNFLVLDQYWPYLSLEPHPHVTFPYYVFLSLAFCVLNKSTLVLHYSYFTLEDIDVLLFASCLRI